MHKNGDKYQINNYRYISILPVFYQLFDKVFHERMAKFMNENRILPSSQYCFRKGHSTTRAVYYFIINIKKILDP
jgi:hypothetical protein